MVFIKGDTHTRVLQLVYLSFEESVKGMMRSVTLHQICELLCQSMLFLKARLDNRSFQARLDLIKDGLRLVREALRFPRAV